MLEIKRECTGCMACLNICPVGAITVKTDEYGFIMPCIDKEKCISCGKCDDVCVLNKNTTHFVEQTGIEKYESIYPINAYSVYNLDEEIVKKSSSGGAFYTLANNILMQGGIVFGCYYDEKEKSAYLTDTDHVNLDKLLTSKYVESYIGNGFIKVKKQLDSSRKVLFCGTPCQCAGLKSFLKKEYDNLLTVDFTCGAVASQKVLANYLEGMEEKYNAKVKRLNFRDKKYGWGQYCMAVDFDNGKKYRRTAMNDSYFFCFLRSSMQRLSCHGCRFSNAHKSDIILADFWKCYHFDVDTNNKKGISLVLTMTEKGEKAIDKIKDNVHIEKLDKTKASYNLKPRECPNSKLKEIEDDQSMAYKYGVTKLRKKLLSPKQRLVYGIRQYIMDKPELSKRYQRLVGNGQIMVCSNDEQKYNSINSIIKKMNDSTISVISFDIFDTLIVRTIGSPSDLFELLDKYFKQLNASAISFRKIRVEAENVLRRMITSGEIKKEDITLDEIYDVITSLFGVEKTVADRMKNYETELECELCKPRKTGQRLYKEAIKTGKRVILTSDMYLEEAVVTKILDNCGYKGWHKLYLSSTLGLRKVTGNLYKYIVTELGVKSEQILHIGDNEQSDYELAVKNGCQSVWLPSARYMYENKGCGNQVKKICGELTNWEAAQNSVGIGIMRQLAANKYFDDPFRQFEEKSDYNADAYFIGYAALGMELLSLVNWIIKCAKEDGVNNVIFMARDGYLPLKAYELLSQYKELPKASYLYVSRIAVLPAMIHTALDLYDLPMDLNYQTPNKLLLRLSFCMKDIEENELDNLLKENGFSDYDLIFTKSEYLRFISLFIKYLYDETKHENAKKRIAGYMLENENAKITDNCALFDMGYSGRIPEAIIHSTGIVPHIYYFHSDSREHFRYEKISGMKIKTFFDFNPYMESSIREYSYLEATSSCIGYDEKLNPIFDIGPAPGYEKNVNLMQKGALDFIKDFMDDFGEFEKEAAYRYHDASMPFEAFIRYCSKYDRSVYDNVLIDDELWGGRRNIDLKELMEIRLAKIPQYAKENKNETN